MNLEKAAIVAIAILLFIEGIFSGFEIAFLSLRPYKLKGKLKKFAENFEELIATTLTGTNLTVVANSTILAYILKNYVGKSSELFTTIILSPLALIFGETIPKTIAKNKPSKFLKFFLPFFNIFFIATYPLRKVFLLVPHALGVKIKKDSSISREEIPLMLDEEDKKKLVKTIVSLKEKRVKESMKPITNIIALEKSDRVFKTIELAEKTGYTRFPVYSEHIYNIVGIVWILDVIAVDLHEKVENYVRQCPFISELQSLYSAIKTFKLTKSPIAIVVNEYGLATGILTIEDLFEEFVGEIEDEFDLYSEKPRIIKVDNNSIIVSGETKIEEVEEVLKVKLINSESYKTLSGFIIYWFDKMPDENEVLKFDNLIFRIIKVGKGKIEKVEVAKTENGE